MIAVITKRSSAAIAARFAPTLTVVRNHRLFGESRSHAAAARLATGTPTPAPQQRLPWD
jgi:hypothetical protein